MPAVEIISDHDCPIPTPVVIPHRTGNLIRLKERGGSLVLPTQVRAEGGVIALIPALKAKERRVFEIQPAGAPRESIRVEEGPGALSITLPEGPLTTYHFSKDAPRPYLFPVLGPGGKAVTRSYPMKKDVPGESKDHPHHRSFWTAYGEVNGVDDWSETPGKHGFIRHQKFEQITGGPVWGGFTATAVWTGPDEKPLLNERRRLRAYNVGPDYRLLDYDVELIAAYGDVHYGDTKEGGILAFRVATTMDGNKGGRLENSSGGIGEKQVWGKRANWLDYSGPVEGQIMGIGMMDHPANWGHPCYWHARDYGLVGTNSFAGSAFDRDAPKTGHTQKSGSTLHFRFRVLLHRGDAKEGKVDQAYHAWIQPPRVRAL